MVSLNNQIGSPFKATASLNNKAVLDNLPEILKPEEAIHHPKKPEIEEAKEGDTFEEDGKLYLITMANENGFAYTEVKRRQK